MVNAVPLDAADFQSSLIELAILAPAGSVTRRAALDAATTLDREISIPVFGEKREHLLAMLHALDDVDAKTSDMRFAATTIARAIERLGPEPILPGGVA